MTFGGRVSQAFAGELAEEAKNVRGLEAEVINLSTYDPEDQLSSEVRILVIIIIICSSSSSNMVFSRSITIRMYVTL